MDRIPDPGEDQYYFLYHYERAKIEEIVRTNTSVDEPDENGITTLMMASRGGNIGGLIDIVKELLEKNANVNTKDNNGRTPLVFAAAGDNIEVVETLLDHGADVHTSDNDGVTPLMMTDDEEVARKLIGMGVDVNATDNQERTALLYHYFYSNIPSQLVKAGADVDATDMFGRTQLLRLAGTDFSGPFKQLLKQLLGLGANINARDNQGRTVVMTAVMYDDYFTAQFLVQQGADITHRDRDGKSMIGHCTFRDSYDKQIVAKMIKHFYGDRMGRDGLLSELSNLGHFDVIQRTLKLFEDTREIYITARSIRELTFLRVGLQPPLPWDRIYRSTPFITRYLELDDYPINILIPRTDDMKDQMLRGYCLNLTSDIIKIVSENTDLPDQQPYNISLDSFEDDNSHAYFFRYGSDTVMSIYRDADGSPQVSHLKATAPICAGEGRVIYTKVTSDGASRVYENSIDLKGDEKELCHSLSSRYEKNWGCFGRDGAGPLDRYFIVYSIFPLRIFEVRNRSECTEVQSVLREYPNFDRIEKMWVDERGLEDTSIFRGGSRGISFGDEYLFVGHVTLSDRHCFPHSGEAHIFNDG